MQKRDAAVILGSLGYSFLFYEQNAGLNFLLFNSIVIGLFLWRDFQLSASLPFIFYSVCALFASVCTVFYASSLSVIAGVLTIALLSTAASNRKVSPVVNLLHSVYSLFVAPVQRLRESRKRSGTMQVSVSGNSGMLFFFFSICLVVVFFALYRQANPLFARYTEALNLQFISLEWFFFTLGGFMLMSAAFWHFRINGLDEWESTQSRKLDREEQGTIVPAIRKSLLLLFALINIMVLIICILDIRFLYLGAELPEGITHKQFVHDGVNMLILSILLGIAVILFDFRGSLNFDHYIRPLKRMVYSWLVLNLFIVFSTAARNHLYITEALLTYKRIGVYFWLFFAVCGLVTTWIKVSAVRPNWFLLQVNSIIGVIVLVLSCAVDWDVFISNYNISQVSHLSSLDKRYLLSLSDKNTVQLYKLRNQPGFNVDSVWHYRYKTYCSNSALLDSKLYSFIYESDRGDWRSFSLAGNDLKKQIEALNKSQWFDSLDLSESVLSMSKIEFFAGLKILTLPGYNHFSAEELESLKKLKNLEIIRISAIDSAQVIKLKTLPFLKYLDVSITDKRQLEDLKRHASPLIII